MERDQGALSSGQQHPELIAGVCSLNGTANMIEYAKFQDAIIASYGGTKDQVPDEYKKRSAELWPEKAGKVITDPKDLYLCGDDAQCKLYYAAADPKGGAVEHGAKVFDAPGWIMDGSKGPGLFDAFEPCGQRAYRTTTPDSEHSSVIASAR